MQPEAVTGRDRHVDLTQPLRAALQAGIELLRQSGVEDAAVDARRLLIAAIRGDALELVRSPSRLLTLDESEHYKTSLSRRSRGEPVSRIIGSRGFYGREFQITPATLDPRPETEVLIETALACVRDRWPNGRGLHIIDIGTGSGCLLLTLLAELPEATGIGVDPSRAALDVAAGNAGRLGVADRCQWIEGQQFAAARGRFGLIISNPPYIPTADIAALDREVREQDPPLALDGGTDGLDVYRAIASDLDRHAAGWAIFEIGHDQAQAVVEIMGAAIPHERLHQHIEIPDMAGKSRCVAFEIQG